MTTTYDIDQLANLSMYDLLVDAAGEAGTRPAVEFGDAVMDYADLLRSVDQCAANLETLGVVQGTRVAFLLPSCTEWVILQHALARLGGVAVGLSLAYAVRELRHVLEVTQAEHVVLVRSYRGRDYEGILRELDAGFTDGVGGVGEFPSVRSVNMLDADAQGAVDPLSPGHERVFGRAGAPSERPSVTGDDPAMIIFASGSTAFPKPAVVPHRALVGAGVAYARALRLDGSDRVMSVLPTFHVAGPLHPVMAAAHRIPLVLTGHFAPARVLEQMEAKRVTTVISFLTHVAKLSADPTFGERDISSLRSMVLGAAPTIMKDTAVTFGLDTIVSVYGSTEGPLVTASDPHETDLDRRVNNNGRSIAGMEVRIVDPDTEIPCAPGVTGEIRFRGITQFLGYLPGTPGADQAFDDEAFFRSGDYGMIDADGYLYLRGRYKQMIKTGGENVAELEVETFLLDELPIEVAQVVGVPDPTWGEAVVAFVQLKPDAGDLDTEDLRAMCKGRVAGFKVPKRFFVMKPSDWPVLANERIDKAPLREMARQLTSG